MTIAARVANRGDTTDTDLVALRVDGRLVATKGVRVGAGDSELVTFERTFDRAGDHEIAVEGVELPALTVVPSEEATPTPTPRSETAAPANDPASPAPEAVEVVSTGGLADWVRSGYNASVRATLANSANRSAMYTVRVAVDGRPVANETVLLGANARTTVSIAFPAIEGTVTVDGVEAGQLTVGDAWEPAQTTARTTEGAGPGLGLALVGRLFLLAALAAVAARVRRRRR